jgi:hypothetical protein
MFSRKIWLKITLITGLFLLGSTNLKASSVSDFATQATNDVQTIAAFINGPFSHSMGFISTLGWTDPPSVFDLVTGPHLEVGLGAGADLINLPNLSSLSLPAIVANSNVSLPTFLPFPYPVATARIGLSNSLDFGVRATYLPQVDIPSFGFAANYTGYGFDLRYKILDQKMLPTVTVGASWDTMYGSFGLSTNVNQNSTYSDGGNNYNVNYTGTTGYALNWDVKSFGAQIQCGMDLGGIYPFGSVGFQRNSGDVTSTISTNGTVVLTGPGGGTGPVDAQVSSGSAPVVLEPKFVLGLDAGQGFHFAIVGESNGTEIAGEVSFRAAF